MKRVCVYRCVVVRCLVRQSARSVFSYPPSAVAIFNGHEPLVFQYRNSNDFEIMLVFYSVFGFVLVVAFASLEFYFKHLSMCIGKIIFMNSFLDLDYMSTYLHMCAVCVCVCAPAIEYNYSKNSKLSAEYIENWNTYNKATNLST